MPDSERSAPADFGRVLLALIVGQIGLHATMAGVRMAAPLQALRQGHSAWSVGVLMALFSFMGIEFVVGTASEAEDPKSAIPAALRTMAARLFLFYILALFIIVAFIPWTSAGAKVLTESPFVRMFAGAGIPVAGSRIWPSLPA